MEKTKLPEKGLDFSGPGLRNRAIGLFVLITLMIFGTVIPVFCQDFPPNYTEDDDEPISYEPEPPPEDPPPPPEVKPAPPGPIRLAQKVVMIGRVPYMSIKDMMAHSKALMSYLRKEMGVKEVRLVTSKNYAGVLQALSRGTIDFAWLGPTAYVLGKDKMPLFPIVKTQRRTGSSYRGVFITRKDRQILGIDDIKGKIVGFVDPESASGYLYPLALLKRSKINPHKVCKKVEFLKKHDAVLAAVLSGKIDAGVCLEDTLLGLKGKKELDDLLVLGKTDEVPSDVIVCREDCQPVLRDKFREALLKSAEFNKAGKNADPQAKLPEFLSTNDEEFNSVRDVVKTIKDVIK